MKSIDIKTVELIARLMKLDPIAPLAPLALPMDYIKGSEGAFGMAKDIQYLTKTVDEIKQQLKEITNNHVTIQDFNDHAKMNERAHLDFETRMRTTETTQTRILTWGSIIIGLTTLAQVVLKFAGQ